MNANNYKRGNERHTLTLRTCMKKVAFKQRGLVTL